MAAPPVRTFDELRQFIAQAGGESEQIEFKRTTGELQGAMESLCGFLNGSGGHVLFGVAQDARIQGQDVSDSTLQEVANAIRRLEPPAWIEQTRIPVPGGREVLVLETTHRERGPYTYDGRPYQRIGPTTSRMVQSDYERRLLWSMPTVTATTRSPVAR